MESFGRSLIMHNIVVRPLPGAREKFEIIAGHRRVEAARRKGLGQIEAKIVQVDDLTAEQLALEENVRRRALPDEASAFARLLEVYEQQRPTKRGGDRRSKRFDSNRQAAALMSGAARVAAVTGQSERDVRRKIRIGQLAIPKVKRALTEGRIGVLEAEKLARLSPRQQKEQLAGLVKSKGDVNSDLRRVSEALKYAVDHLRAKEPARVAGAKLAELEARVKELVEIISMLGRQGRRTRARRTRARVATAERKPERVASGSASFEAKSANAKLGPVGYVASTGDRPRPVAMAPFVSATSASIAASCPNDCVFKNTPGHVGGCFADAGFTRLKIQKLDAAAEGFGSTEVIKEEVRLIDSSFGGGRVPQDGADGKGRQLRVHVAGDVQTAEEAALLGGAAARWRARGGGAPWTYTHAWRTVPRPAWGDSISVLASVETPRDMLLARRAGYAPALVVPSFPNGPKAFHLDGAKKIRIVPCPAETTPGTTCATCKLCLDRPLLKMGVAVGFAVHGQHSEHALAVLRTAAAESRGAQGASPRSRRKP